MLKLIRKNRVDWDLLMRVLSGELPENDPDFVSWLAEDEENQTLYKSLVTPDRKDARLFNTKKMYRKVESELFGKPAGKSVRILLAKYAAAVSILAFLSLSAYYLIDKQKSKNVTIQTENLSVLIEPGSKKALLVMEDGSSIELKDKFRLEKENGTVIENDTSGIVSFQQRKLEVKPEYHSIKVPLGGEYELKLADGTRVFINSGSILKFPSFFAGKERRVELEGEAYFEVEKSEIPFIVRIQNAEIEVLGTSFNVSAYNEDPSLNATLITGSILMKTASNDKGYQLHPGQNLNLDKNSEQVKIENVDTEIYTAWIRGEYIFRNQSMEDILDKLSKWYDFEIKFENVEIKKMRFTGSVNKKRPLRYFLRQIQEVTNLKFNEYGNMIEVYQ
ncbi:MAG: DUF4974 domain-containing protein [Tannerella sp.]|jgi:ferric-dicitrate binding protein FerR (iron transport regulator)|nr:DUF4974 domain-containing protein [Tannerella sp.]